MASDHFDANGSLTMVKHFSWPAVAVWIALWMLPLALSRYARYRVQSGNYHWSQWVLLPVYEVALFAKKVAVVLVVLANGSMGSTFNNLTMYSNKDSTTIAVGISLFVWFLSWVSSNLVFIHMIADPCCIQALYYWSYLTVLHALCAQSAGTESFRKANFITLMFTLADGFVAYSETGGYFNAYGGPLLPHKPNPLPCYDAFPDAARLDLALCWGPSWLSTSLPADHFFKWYSVGIPYIHLWELVTCIVICLTGTMLHFTHVWTIRQPLMALAVSVMMVTVFVEMMFVIPIYDHTNLVPTLIVACLEAPFFYSILILDSRYWSSLSLDADNNSSALDALSEPLVGHVSLAMSNICRSKLGENQTYSSCLPHCLEDYPRERFNCDRVCWHIEW